MMTGLVSKSSDPTAEMSASDIYIWRPKSQLFHTFTHDIITSTEEPPCGAVLVSKGDCKPATKLLKVFGSTKLGLSIWRPVAPDGYVSLGDIASNHAQNEPINHQVHCIPRTVARTCSIGRN